MIDSGWGMGDGSARNARLLRELEGEPQERHAQHHLRALVVIAVSLALAGVIMDFAVSLSPMLIAGP